MPKAKKYILAKDESTRLPLLQRISVGDPSHFADVGKSRPVYKGRVKPYTPVAGRREELARLQELDTFKTRLLREDYQKEQQRKKLADRITSPPPPLIDRIAPAVAAPAEEPKSLLERLHFHTHAQANRIRAYSRKFEGTSKHLEPFFALFQKRKEEVPEETRSVLESFALRFNFLTTHLEEIVEKKDLSAAQWKTIDLELKKAGQHSFKQLKPRFLEHCTELVLELGVDWLDYIE